MDATLQSLESEFQSSCAALWEADSVLMAENPSTMVQAQYRVIKLRQQLADAKYMARLHADKAKVLEQTLADALEERF